MNRKDLEKQLIEDGLSKDLIRDGKVSQCMVCQEKYGSELIPTLLGCGHIICQVCLEDEPNCPRKTCKKAKTIKVKMFTKLVQYLNCKKVLDDDVTFNFSIKHFNKCHVTPVLNQKGDTKLRDVLKQS
jgi:hypothetical protein